MTLRLQAIHSQDKEVVPVVDRGDVADDIQGDPRLRSLRIKSKSQRKRASQLSAKALRNSDLSDGSPDVYVSNRKPLSLMAIDELAAPQKRSVFHPESLDAQLNKSSVNGLVVSILLATIGWLCVVGIQAFTPDGLLSSYSLENALVIACVPPMLISVFIFNINLMFSIVDSKYEEKSVLLLPHGSIKSTLQVLAQPQSQSKKSDHGDVSEFMSTIPFILEGLHSLSVDVARGKENGVSQNTWRAYQGGDIDAFTKRLIKARHNWNLSQARRKFTKDNTFRHHIRSFLGQFDAMISQARDCDYDGLLIGTIGSSEVAKLYSFLCRVARRKSALKT